MRKIFTLGFFLVIGSTITKAQAPIFLQNFNNAAISSYVNDGMDIGNSTHLNAVQNSSVNFARSIVTGADAGRLQLEKKTNAAGSWISRTTALKSTAPTFLKIQFVMSVTGKQTSTTSYNAHGSFVVGNGTGIRSVYATSDFPSAAATHSMFYFYFPSPISGEGGSFPGFSLVSDTTNIGNSTVFSGDQQFTIFVNNSGLSATYVDPKGNESSLANDKMDVWVGTTLVFDEKTAVSADAAIDGFKFSWSPIIPNGAILQFDNLTIYDESVATLPVTFSSFDAKKTAIGNVLLSWKTASEHNNSYYTILRSGNGDNFKVIGEVKSKGNSNHMQQYSFNDSNPLNGVNYYKLIQTDMDGNSAEYKEIISMNISGQKEKSCTVYYNLSTENIVMNAYSDVSIQSTITVFDVGGKELKKIAVNLIRGYNDINIPLVCKKGIYIVSIHSPKGSQGLKFTVP